MTKGKLLIWRDNEQDSGRIVYASKSWFWLASYVNWWSQRCWLDLMKPDNEHGLFVLEGKVKLEPVVYTKSLEGRWRHLTSNELSALSVGEKLFNEGEGK
jgi:hypothetical protein